MSEDQEQKDYPLDGWVRVAEREAEAERNAAEEAALAAQEPLQTEKEEESDAEDISAMKQLVEAFASGSEEEEEPTRVNWSVPSILAGDILSARWFRHHLGLILLILGFTMIYITDRYIGQKRIIEINKLRKELKDKRYQSLSRSAQALEKCRQSKVEESLRAVGDTTLKSAVPPYEIITNEP